MYTTNSISYTLRGGNYSQVLIDRNALINKEQLVVLYKQEIALWYWNWLKLLQSGRILLNVLIFHCVVFESITIINIIKTAKIVTTPERSNPRKGDNFLMCPYSL